MVSVRYDELNSDPDSYLGIARNLISMRGYSTPGTENPTAFRPPLYPLLISPIAEEQTAWARGLLNIFAAVIAAMFIWKSGDHLGFCRTAKTISTLVYVFDPLLIRYSSLSMTESVCSMMAALLIWILTQPANKKEVNSTVRSALLSGTIFGLCVLTRPTFWAFGGLLSLYVIYRQFTSSRITTQRFLSHISVAVLGVFLIVSPWLFRNLVVFKEPILMTSHGGYTILLGNNEAFYAEVVAQPWGTVWDGSKGPGQGVWAHEMNQKMDSIGLVTEVERDQWMSQRARETIVQNPRMFLKACVLRFIRFWNITPSGPAAQNIPRSILFIVGFYYSIIWFFAIFGVITVAQLPASERTRWVPIFLLILAFNCVHLIYWSNVRMRAPIVPAISLIVGAAATRLSSTHQDSLNGKVNPTGTTRTA